MKQYLDQQGVEYLWGRIKRNFANLSNNGKVPASQLPSYVDDVEEYESLSSFPSQGEESKIYVAKNTNLTYRWSGSTYVEISQSIALGETSNTAYSGDKGKQLENNIDAEINRAKFEEADIRAAITAEQNRATAALNAEIQRAKEAEATITSNLNNHISDYHNPHKVTKAQVGLSDVDNTSDADKPVSNATQIELDKKANQTQVNQLQQTITNLQTTIQQLQSQITNMSTTIESVQNNITNMQTTINTLPTADSNDAKYLRKDKNDVTPYTITANALYKA